MIATPLPNNRSACAEASVRRTLRPNVLTGRLRLAGIPEQTLRRKYFGGVLEALPNTVLTTQLNDAELVIGVRRIRMETVQRTVEHCEFGKNENSSWPRTTVGPEVPDPDVTQLVDTGGIGAAAEALNGTNRKVHIPAAIAVVRRQKREASDVHTSCVHLQTTGVVEIHARAPKGGAGQGQGSSDDCSHSHKPWAHALADCSFGSGGLMER